MGPLEELIDLIKGLHGAAKMGTNAVFSPRRSISSRAMDGTCIFPMVVDGDLIPIEDAMTIARAWERTCASFLLTTITMSPFLKVDDSGIPSAADYLKKIHMNMTSTNDYKNMLSEFESFDQVCANHGIDYSVLESSAALVALNLYQGIQSKFAERQLALENFLIEDVTEPRILNESSISHVFESKDSRRRSRNRRNHRNSNGGSYVDGYFSGGFNVDDENEFTGDDVTGGYAGNSNTGRNTAPAPQSNTGNGNSNADDDFEILYIDDDEPSSSTSGSTGGGNGSRIARRLGSAIKNGAVNFVKDRIGRNKSDDLDDRDNPYVDHNGQGDFKGYYTGATANRIMSNNKKLQNSPVQRNAPAVKSGKNNDSNNNGKENTNNTNTRELRLKPPVKAKMMNERRQVNYNVDAEFKKANDLVPTMLHMRVYPINDDLEGGEPIDFVMGIKCQLHPVTTDQMVTEIAKGIAHNDTLFNFIKWTTGETKFFKDFLFAVDQQKADAYQSVKGDNAALIVASKRRKNVASVWNKFAKNPLTPILSILVTQEDLDLLRDNYGYDTQKMPNLINTLMKNFYLLGFMNLNLASERVDILIDGQSRPATYTLSTLAKENTTDDRKFKEMMKMIGRRM